MSATIVDMYNPNSKKRVNPLLVIIIVGIIAGLLFYLSSEQTGTKLESSSQTAIAPTALVYDEPTATTDSNLAIATETFQPIEIVHEEDEARILIPAAGVSAPIIRVFLSEGNWDISSLGNNVGHLQGTSWLDEPGNIVLSGHVELSSGDKGVFASLNQLQLGDVIILQHNDIDVQYVINDIRNVDPTDLTPLYPTSTNQITLITCDDYNFISDSYDQRVIVVAEKGQS